MRRKKSKKFLVRRVIALVILLVFLIIIGNVIHYFSNKNEQKQTRLLYNNEFVELKNQLYVENKVIYMAEEDVQKIFDSTIYYNVGDKELITTYNKHVAVLHLDETQMIVNDANLDMQGTLKEIDSKVYLPLTDLGIVYDVETEYAENTNLVIMDSTTKAKTQAMLLKNATVKAKKGVFSRALEKVKTGDYLYVLEDCGRYQKVRTKSGNIGYVKTKKVFNLEVLRENWIEEKWEASDFENSDEMLTINKEMAGITNVSTQLTTYSQRNQVINQIYTEVIKGQYHAVCIDFEEIDDVNCFYRFVIELTPKLKESGIRVALKLNSQIDEEKVKNIVDFVIK